MKFWSLGLDPGMDGGYGLLDENRVVLRQGVMPVLGKVFDVHGLATILRSIKRDARDAGVHLEAFLEAASARPGQGVSTMFKFGRVFGLIEGGLGALRIPYELVQPAQWTRTMLAGIEGGDKAKHRNIVAAKRLFPGLDLRRSRACSVPHEGIVDALLISEFGRRKRLSRPIG